MEKHAVALELLLIGDIFNFCVHFTGQSKSHALLTLSPPAGKDAEYW